MEVLDWQGWFTISIVGLLLVAMVMGIAAPDLILMAGLIALALAGVLTPEETFSGFANPAMATVAALFILSAAATRENQWAPRELCECTGDPHRCPEVVPVAFRNARGSDWVPETSRFEVGLIQQSGNV